MHSILENLAFFNLELDAPAWLTSIDFVIDFKLLN